MKITRLNKEFVTFVGVGAFAALVNFCSRIGLSLILNYVTAIIIAYLFGMMTAYILCRCLVFTSSRHSSVHQITWFTLINVLAIAQTIVISITLTKYTFTWINDLSFRETFAHFIGICVPVFTSYLGHKYITFQ